MRGSYGRSRDGNQAKFSITPSKLLPSMFAKTALWDLVVREKGCSDSPITCIPLMSSVPNPWRLPTIEDRLLSETNPGGKHCGMLMVRYSINDVLCNSYDSQNIQSSRREALPIIEPYTSARLIYSISDPLTCSLAVLLSKTRGDMVLGTVRYIGLNKGDQHRRM